MDFAFEPAGIPYPFLAWVIHRGAYERTTDSYIKPFGSVAKRLLCICVVAAVAQLVEHILGKDEVMGSNPISS